MIRHVPQHWGAGRAGGSVGTPSLRGRTGALCYRAYSSDGRITPLPSRASTTGGSMMSVAQ